LSIEAEHFTASFPGTGAAQGVTWQNSTAQPNTSGSCEQALPNAGVRLEDSTEGPQLAFDLKFSGTGTYFVWVRILGPATQSDSVHVAMDSASPVTYGGHGMSASSTSWVWMGTISFLLAPDGGPAWAQINVTAPGYHTLRVYMRESGVALDKIVLNQSGAAPSGLGPSESARMTCGRFWRKPANRTGQPRRQGHVPPQPSPQEARDPRPRAIQVSAWPGVPPPPQV
jgi:hypothetical protein